jgi:hypothetical protein
MYAEHRIAARFEALNRFKGAPSISGLFFHPSLPEIAAPVSRAVEGASLAAGLPELSTEVLDLSVLTVSLYTAPT